MRRQTEIAIDLVRSDGPPTAVISYSHARARADDDAHDERRSRALWLALDARSSSWS
jgi:hypothetical protein